MHQNLPLERRNQGDLASVTRPETSTLGDRLDELDVGQTERVERTITAADVAAFAALSGDFNALHVDPEFAARTEFGQPVAHGFLHASLLSNLVGMKIPGPGALYLSQSIEFSAPVFIGDRLEARATIESIDRDTRIVTLATETLNQKGVPVMRGKARVKVLRLGSPGLEAERAPARRSAMLEGRVALVTGASRGIGRATARLLAAHGAIVTINYHKSEQAAFQLRDEIRISGGTCEAIKADVANDRDVRMLLERAIRADELDILVNNAGPKIVANDFSRLKWQDMASAYADIVGTVFSVTQAALPYLKNAQGTVINVLSSAALGRTAHSWLPYVSAKSALHAMSKNLAQELGPSGVTVNMVSPSLVDTDLVAGTPDRVRQMMIGRTPLRRLATVDDVAGAILMLASPYAGFITGENLLVTGGDVMI